jgi:hypothetical protein
VGRGACRQRRSSRHLGSLLPLLVYLENGAHAAAPPGAIFAGGMAVSLMDMTSGIFDTGRRLQWTYGMARVPPPGRMRT